MTFNSNKVNLLRFVTINLRDKFKIRHMMKRDPLLFHIMLNQGITWFTLASNTQKLYKTVYIPFQDDLCSSIPMQPSIWVLLMPATITYFQCGDYSENDKEDIYIQERLYYPSNIMQTLEFSTLPFSIPGEKDENLSGREKTHHQPFSSYPHLS